MASNITKLSVKEEQQVMGMLVGGFPEAPLDWIYGALGNPVNRLPPLTRQSPLSNCMAELNHHSAGKAQGSPDREIPYATVPYD